MNATERVLVVDDNEATRYVLTTWLRRGGYLVDEAATGAEALAAAGGRCDLVVLDVNLPDVPGPEVCAAIKADPATGSIPVLHVSATAVEVAQRAAGLLGGADAYLVEPLERDELLATVRALLRYGYARRRAEALADRLEWLQRASLDINAAGDVGELVRVATDAVVRLCGPPAAVAVARDDGGVLGVRADSTPTTTTELCRDDLDRMAREPAAVLEQVLGAGRSPAVPLRAVTAPARPGTGSAAVIVAGAPPEPDEATERVLDQLAQVAGLAAENRLHYAREHDIAVTLQRSLLPAVPTVPWLDVAVRYVASTAQAEVGGDFYDVVVLDDDQVVLVIGDVEGHSLRAATVMATLRSSLAAYLLAGRPPASALDQLHRVLRRMPEEVLATVCCVLVHRDGEAVVANAGHLPPVVATGGGAVWLQPGGTVLGVEGPAGESRLRLEPGSSLVLFTDGLVEVRGRPLEEGIGRVVAAIGPVADDVEAICDRLVADAATGRVATDDIAVLAARLRPPDGV